MLAMVAVGIWGAFLGRPLVFLLPMIFPAMMAVGGGLGTAAVAFPPVELGIALSVLLLGFLIAAGARPPVAVACIVVAIFALFHGYAHGSELPSAADPVGYSLGFVTATGLLHVAGIGLGVARRLPGGSTALRVTGAAIAAAGLWFFTAALA